NITITNNHFFNNRGDIVLADGKTALIEGNRFESRIGFFGWEAFKDVTLTRNHFEGNGIAMRGNGVASKNTIVNGGSDLLGSGIIFEDNEIIDGTLRIDSSSPFGVEVSRLIMINNNVQGGALYLASQPTRLTDVTIQGPTTLYTILGPGSSESVYQNLRVIDYNVKNGTNLPPGTYNGCYFESNSPESNGLVLNVPGTYVFNDCQFIANNKLMSFDHDQADITVRNSEFTIRG
ncbi:right-handed parallel beta-helix repeat-containing protein, partial [Cutibacterium acnes]